ncbi:flocculation protein FLO11 isoform X9 [Drosophila guanche]|uniref:flocculation protein FLO11 isoform X9 n=1 Tax=Drosophila guanche TaxID=7266 RepID=UPI0014708882|nr:flocculation protein FLO11 isoform X9 [Drosophila guanche]
MLATCCHGFSQQQQQQQHQQQQQRVEQGAAPLNVSQAISTSTMESCKSRSRNLLPMCQMPISISVSISERLQQQTDLQQHHHQQQQQVTPTSHQQLPQHQQQSHRHKHHRCSCSHESQNFCSGSVSSGNSSNPPAFNLVKLFIKQKSTSSGHEEPLLAQASAHTCMDVSSGCWPSSDAASSSSGSLEQRLRKKSMNDSGKGSAVSRHDEEEEEEGGHYADQQTPPKQRQLRARADAVFYDDAASSSSTGSLTATNSPAHRRRSMPLRNPQLYQLAAAQTSTASQMSSEASTEEQLTQVPRRGAEAATTRPLSCASSSEMITRSMQTSCGSLSTTRSSLSERYRCVPPSFLEKLNNLGEQRQAPIYVIYPNYALPDLGFVKTTAATPDVIFSPFNYKMTLDGTANSSGSLKKPRSGNSTSSRQSINEDELFKTMDYKHIADWQSLATLLPVEYRRRLQHIPEVKQLVRQLDADLAQRPLFCMSPPLRRNRTHICDCAKYFQQTQAGHGQTQLQDEGSSSGSSQPPSSGYRGSSTLLTDSELDADADPLKQMYVYQYDQQQQMHTTPPQPMPRSILRKANSAQARTKRNSMIEGGQQTQKMSKLEKRRSLQEPPYNYALGSTDELLADVFEEEEQQQAQAQSPAVKQRLSRKDLDARARAENFLASLPRSELKYYAEIASILETSGEHVQYDAAALKKEVSRVLSQQKKVSFTDEAAAAAVTALTGDAKRFSTPPNSPNISMAAAMQRRETLDVMEQRKIESNRFKRLQIQWELMSKDSSMLKELACEAATKSGGSTPTSTNSTGSNSAPRSRIPRPVSYPAGRSSTPTSTRTAATVVASPSPARVSAPAKTVTKSHNKTLSLLSSPRLSRLSSAQQDAANGGKPSSSTRSPSRIVPPKRYSLAGTPTHTHTPTPTSTPTSAPATGRARTPTNRVAVTAPNTPKRQAGGVAPSPRPTSRVR